MSHNVAKYIFLITLDQKPSPFPHGRILIFFFPRLLFVCFFFVTGARNQEDLYIRLIDSNSKQVGTNIVHAICIGLSWRRHFY